jgi:hypothetical protein
LDPGADNLEGVEVDLDNFEEGGLGRQRVELDEEEKLGTGGIGAD